MGDGEARAFEASACDYTKARPGGAEQHDTHKYSGRTRGEHAQQAHSTHAHTHTLTHSLTHTHTEQGEGRVKKRAASRELEGRNHRFKGKRVKQPTKKSECAVQLATAREIALSGPHISATDHLDRCRRWESRSCRTLISPSEHAIDQHDSRSLHDARF